MPESLYHPSEIATCRPNGFGLCETHVTCGHVKESLHEFNMDRERLRQELRVANTNIERKQEEIASLRNACRMNESIIKELRTEVSSYQHSTTQHVEIRNDQGDRIERWRQEIRMVLELMRSEQRVAPYVALEKLLGEE